MRHSPWISLPEPVALLPTRMIQPPPLAALVAGPGLPHRAAPGHAATTPTAVPLPPVAARAHHDLPRALPTDVQPAVRQHRASVAGAAYACESDAPALYCSQRGPRPANGSGVGLPTMIIAAVSFSAAIIHIRGPSFPLIRPDPIKTPIDDTVSSQPRHSTRITRVYVAGDNRILDQT